MRLVTLTGPGGVGKSRLAIRVAEEVVADFPDGVWFVPLSAVRDAGLVPATVAERLGLREAGSEPIEAMLRTFLQHRHALVVLDNLEHLTPIGPLLADLLAACPALSMLVTSREVLHLSGEHVYAVPPLAMPGCDDPATLDRLVATDAVRLFVERATAADADFVINEECATAIATICQRLDGLPLAIELAAARVGAFAPATLIARLERRLPVLTSGPRDAPPRLRTLRDSIVWSYDLLAPDEQDLFRRLSVFVGGFTPEAAAYVMNGLLADLSPTVLDAITSLVGKSLLRPMPTHTEARFGMLETLREFGLELLAASGEETAVRDAHATWYVEFAERAEPELSGPQQDAWVTRIEAELGNIRAAMSWLRERSDAEAALRLATALAWFWESPGHYHEGRDLFEGLIGMPGAERVPAALARATAAAADLADWLGDPDRSLMLYERTLALYRALGDLPRVAGVLRGLGSVAIDRREPERAVALLQESVCLAREIGEDWEAAAATNLLGTAAFGMGDYRTAIARHDEAAAAWRRLGDHGHVVAALGSLGRAALLHGELDRAVAAFAETLDIGASTHNRLAIPDGLAGLGMVASSVGDHLRAARLLGAAGAHLAAIGVTTRPIVQEVRDRFVASTRTELGEDVFVEAWREGQTLPLDDVIAEARMVSLRSDQLSRTAEPAMPASAHGLSRREVEVLRLLAAGLTDREIAERLYISRRTASHHAAAILGKLGVDSRREAAARARELGLA